MSLHPLQSRAVVAGIVLLRTDGAALLQLRDDKPGLNAAGQWVFPGGHCDDCEDLAVCAQREFEEETGYRCSTMAPLITLHHRSPDTGKEFRLNFYWAEYDCVQSIHCFEGQKICFVTRPEAEGLPMPDYILQVWDMARERQAGVRAGKERFTVGGKPGSQNHSS